MASQIAARDIKMTSSVSVAKKNKKNASRKKIADGFENWLPSAIERHLKIQFGKRIRDASGEDLYRALGLCLREHLIDRAMINEDERRDDKCKMVHYLSMEFLIGPLLENNLLSMRLREDAEKVMRAMGFDLDEIIGTEPDPALGNGGLGRLAACFLDSMATLGIPGFGYGINYEYGLFTQSFSNGWQLEAPDHWKIDETPWQLQRLDEQVFVPIYGYIAETVNDAGDYVPSWLDWNLIVGVPKDMPIVGYGGETVNYLRLYSARASNNFDMRIFNQGDYVTAVEEKMRSENISKVLYPDDSVEAGQELRLVQEYFLVACSLRNIVTRHLNISRDIESLPDTTAIQLNDTHPALAIVELMRLLVDEHHLEWEKAWTIVNKTFAYTNHTLLPEALECWPVHLVKRVIPRHLQLIYEINRRFMEDITSNHPDIDPASVSIFSDQNGDTENIRMGHLSIIGSHSVNGVAALHSELIKSRLVPQFHALWPEKFNNKTNGVTQRRWLLQANPDLAGLVTDCIGETWITDLNQLRRLEEYKDQSSFLDAFAAAKQKNKEKLSNIIMDINHCKIDPHSLFDVQVKRIHEYKRQLLNVLKIVHLYLRITEDGVDLPAPQTFVFAGKAAPGYVMAKRIIKLINSIAAVINTDVRVKDQIKVVLLPNYRVSLAAPIFASADASEQISTAGFEASGTGNMKLALNGAVTIGTLDGANVEIAEEVGDENIYIFGLKADDIVTMRERGEYNPLDYYHRDENLKRVIDLIESDFFCPQEPEVFSPIVHNIKISGDYFMVMADFHSYVAKYETMMQDYSDQDSWRRMALLNMTRIGKFSSDRTIKEYAQDIWNLPV